MIYLVMARRIDSTPHGDRQTVWAVDEFVTLEEALEHYVSLIEDGWDRILVSQKIEVAVTVRVQTETSKVEVGINNRAVSSTKKS